MKRLLFALLIALPLLGQQPNSRKVIPLLPEETAKLVQLRTDAAKAWNAIMAVRDTQCRYQLSLRMKYAVKRALFHPCEHGFVSLDEEEAEFSDDGKYLIEQ